MPQPPPGDQASPRGRAREHIEELIIPPGAPGPRRAQRAAHGHRNQGAHPNRAGTVLGNAASEIFDELQPAYFELTLAPILAHVRDLPRIRTLFTERRFHVVFHPAAHKQVPLVEDKRPRPT